MSRPMAPSSWARSISNVGGLDGLAGGNDLLGAILDEDAADAVHHFDLGALRVWVPDILDKHVYLRSNRHQH